MNQTAVGGRGGIQSASEVHDADPAQPAAFLSLKRQYSRLTNLDFYPIIYNFATCLTTKTRNDEKDIYNLTGDAMHR